MMTREEFSDRFRLQAGFTMDDPKKIERAVELLCNIEQVEDIAAISDILHK